MDEVNAMFDGIHEPMDEANAMNSGMHAMFHRILPIERRAPEPVDDLNPG